MADAKFEKVTHSDKPFYGPRKLLVCGFDDTAQTEFKKLLQMTGIKGIPISWVVSDQADTVLAELYALPDNSGNGVSSTLPRAIVVSGITENELHRLMNTCRKNGMPPALWAALTPTSETWTLQSLLAELTAERKAMSKRK